MGEGMKKTGSCRGRRGQREWRRWRRRSRSTVSKHTPHVSTISSSGRLHHSPAPTQYFTKKLVFCVKLFLSIPIYRTLPPQWTSSCLSHSSVTYWTSPWTFALRMYVFMYIAERVCVCVCVCVCKSTLLWMTPLQVGTSFIHKLDGQHSLLNQYLTIN